MANSKPDNNHNNDLASCREQIKELRDKLAKLAHTLEKAKNDETRFRDIAELLPGVVYESDLDYNLTFFNQNAFELTGYSQEDIDNGLNARFIIDPKDWETLESSSKRILAGENIEGNIYTVVKKDGNKFPVIIRANLILKNNRPVGFRGVAIDVTKLREAERELRESEKKYRLLLEQSNDAVYLLVDKKFEFVNNRFVELLGWTREELLSPEFDIICLAAPSSKKLIENRLEVLDKGDTPSSKYEYTALTKDGREVDLEVSISYVKLEGKQVIQGIYRDITERNRLQKATEDAHYELNQIFQAATPMIVIDRDYNITKINATYQNFFRASEADIIGKKCYDVYPSIYCHSSECAVKQILEGNRQYEYEDITKLDDGSDIHSLVTAYPYRDPNGEILGIVESFKDITERKKTEKALRESEAKFKSQFKGIPVPTYSWQKQGDDFVLTDFNDAAVKITRNKIQGFLGIKFSVLYQDMPEYITDINRCYEEHIIINKETPYKFQSTGEKKYISVRYAYVPPDLVIVHTEDITEKKMNELRNKARLKLLIGLRTADSIDSCLKLGCEAIRDAEMFKRAVLTFHNNKREIINLGQVGLSDEIINIARHSPAPDKQLAHKLTREEFRINNSYFVPVEAEVPIDQEARYIAPDEIIEGGADSWQTGDELFVPVIGNDNDIEGWLSVDTPADGRRPTINTVRFIEEILDIVIKKTRELHSLIELKKERRALKDKNIAMSVLLDQMEIAKNKYKTQIAETIDLTIMPFVNKLINLDGTINQIQLYNLKTNLLELSSASGRSLKLISRLSTREAEICSMIKSGLSSKGIANNLHITVGTVQKHREKIRQKLKIKNKNVNLASYLRNL